MDAEGAGYDAHIVCVWHGGITWRGKGGEGEGWKGDKRGKGNTGAQGGEGKG